MRLTAAYRSLSRPSSASSAKASTVCPYYLHINLAALARAPVCKLHTLYYRDRLCVSHYSAVKVPLLSAQTL